MAKYCMVHVANKEKYSLIDHIAIGETSLKEVDRLSLHTAIYISVTRRQASETSESTIFIWFSFVLCYLVVAMINKQTMIPFTSALNITHQVESSNTKVYSSFKFICFHGVCRSKRLIYNHIKTNPVHKIRIN